MMKQIYSKFNLIDLFLDSILCELSANKIGDRNKSNKSLKMISKCTLNICLYTFCVNIGFIKGDYFPHSVYY